MEEVSRFTEAGGGSSLSSRLAVPDLFRRYDTDILQCSYMYRHRRRIMVHAAQGALERASCTIIGNDFAIRFFPPTRLSGCLSYGCNYCPPDNWTSRGGGGPRVVFLRRAWSTHRLGANSRGILRMTVVCHYAEDEPRTGIPMATLFKPTTYGHDHVRVLNHSLEEFAKFLVATPSSQEPSSSSSWLRCRNDSSRLITSRHSQLRRDSCPLVQ